MKKLLMLVVTVLLSLTVMAEEKEMNSWEKNNQRTWDVIPKIGYAFGQEAKLNVEYGSYDVVNLDKEDIKANTFYEINFLTRRGKSPYSWGFGTEQGYSTELKNSVDTKIEAQTYYFIGKYDFNYNSQDQFWYTYFKLGLTSMEFAGKEGFDSGVYVAAGVGYEVNRVNVDLSFSVMEAKGDIEAYNLYTGDRYLFDGNISITALKLSLGYRF